MPRTAWERADGTSSEEESDEEVVVRPKRGAFRVVNAPAAPAANPQAAKATILGEIKGMAGEMQAHEVVAQASASAEKSAEELRALEERQKLLQQQALAKAQQAAALQAAAAKAAQAQSSNAVAADAEAEKRAAEARKAHEEAMKKAQEEALKRAQEQAKAMQEAQLKKQQEAIAQAQAAARAQQEKAQAEALARAQAAKAQAESQAKAAQEKAQADALARAQAAKAQAEAQAKAAQEKAQQEALAKAQAAKAQAEAQAKAAQAKAHADAQAKAAQAKAQAEAQAKAAQAKAQAEALARANAAKAQAEAASKAKQANGTLPQSTTTQVKPQQQQVQQQKPQPPTSQKPAVQQPQQQRSGQPVPQQQKPAPPTPQQKPAAQPVQQQQQPQRFGQPQQAPKTQPQQPTLAKVQPPTPQKPTTAASAQKGEMRFEPQQQVGTQAASRVPQRAPVKVQPPPLEFKAAPAPTALNPSKHLKETAKVQEQQLATESTRLPQGIAANRPAIRQENVVERFVEKEETLPEKSQGAARAGQLEGAVRWEAAIAEQDNVPTMGHERPAAVRLQDDSCWMTQHRVPAEVQRPEVGKITIPELSEGHEVHRTIVVAQPQGYERVKWNEFPEEFKPEIGRAPKVKTQEWVPVNQETTDVERSLYTPARIARAWPPPEEELEKPQMPWAAKKASGDQEWIHQEGNGVLKTSAWSSSSKVNRAWPPPEEDVVARTIEAAHMGAVQWPPSESEATEKERVEVLQKHIPAKKMERQWPPPPPQYQVVEQVESEEPVDQDRIMPVSAMRRQQ